MAQKYTLAASTTSFDRLLGAHAPIQLSDGTLVFVYQSASGTWKLAYTTDRATVTDIGTITTGTTAGTFTVPSSVQVIFGLARDASDNIYLSGGVGSSTFTPAAQAWVKGAGYTWTAKAIVSGTVNSTVGSGVLLWCNTGGGTGGAGHLLYAWANGRGYSIIDAGALQSGTYTQASSGGLSAAITSNSQASIDIAADGFGAASGVLAGQTVTSSTIPVQSWSVSSSGVLTQSALTSLAAATTTQVKIRVVRYAANAFAVCFGNSSTGQYSVARYSSTAQLTAATATGSPTGLALNGSGLAWDFFVDPITANKCWVIACNTSSGVVARLAVNVSAGVSWATSVTSDDTLSPLTGAGELLAVNQPTSSQVDWLVYAVVSAGNYALYGDYSALNNAPNAPILTGPASGATIDRTITQRFTWTFSDPDTGDTQSAFDLQYRLVGASTWTTVSGTTTNQYVDIASGTFTAGSYEWQVRTYDSFGRVGPWSASSFFTAATPPAAVAITAPTSGGTIGSASFDVTWSAPTQTDYQVRVVADNAGSADTSTIYSDTGDVVDATARARTMPFPTQGIYVHVQVRIKAGGLWSSYSDVRALVSYTPPATPTVAVAVLQVDGKDVALTVSATHPTPSGSQPTVAYVDIYRRAAGDTGSGARYATQQAASGTWTDWRVASGQAYEYRVLAVGDNGTSTYSAWTT